MPVSSDDEITTIRLSKGLKNELDVFGSKNESYEHIVERLVIFAKKNLKDFELLPK